ncbi:MAG: PQQ-binding-like beta-propeller repeat protein [Planctomycetia bacterium]|nr:PQQ-binding-like beta-propeller repeat protein [Planctomycetia bacterium]
MRSANLSFLFAVVVAACFASPIVAGDWAQWLGPKRDAIWEEKGLVSKFPKDGPPVVWRKPIGEGYAGPAVAGGKLFITDRVKAKIDPKNPPPKGTLPGKEQVHCLNLADGKTIWTRSYDCPYKEVSYPTGPRTTPIIDGDHLYTLGTMGDLLCLEVADGTVVWSKNFQKDYKAPIPLWGWSAHLLLDGDNVIALVGGEGQAVVAFDKKTGREKWKALTTKEIAYSPPIITEAGGKRQLIAWVSEAVYSLNPKTGAEYWKHKHPAEGEVARPAVSIITPKRAGDKLLISSFYHGTLCLTLDKDKPAATVAWRSKNSYPKEIDGINAVMTSLLVKDGHVYGIAGMGEIICQKLDTGEVVRTGTEIFGDKAAFCGSVFWVDAGELVYGLTDQGDLVILKLSPQKCEVLATAHILEPTHAAKGRKAVWSHPAFAGKKVYMKNDKEIVCVSLAG